MNKISALKREIKRMETPEEVSTNSAVNEADNEADNEEVFNELRNIAYNERSLDLYKRACCMLDSKVSVAKVMWYLKNMNETLMYYANINQNNQFYVNITTVKGKCFKCAINVDDCKTVDGRCQIMKIIEKIVYDNTDPVEEITIDPNSICTIERRVTRQSAYSVHRDFDSEESYEEESYEEESYEEESYEESSTESDGNQEKVMDAVKKSLGISDSEKKKKKSVKRRRSVKDEEYEPDGVRSKRIQLERRQRMVILDKKKKEEKKKEKEKEKEKKKKKGKRKYKKRVKDSTSNSNETTKDDNDEVCNKCFDYGKFITCFGNPENQDSESQSTEISKDYIDNMPTYRGLMYTLYDLYLLRYVRKRKNYRAFSYGATGYLLDHITTTNMTSGELRDRLLYYMGYNKFSKVL